MLIFILPIVFSIFTSIVFLCDMLRYEKKKWYEEKVLILIVRDVRGILIFLDASTSIKIEINCEQLAYSFKDS